MPRGQRLDLTGQRFGRWEALRPASPSRDGQRRWTWRCECGGEGAVVERNLTRGVSRSCGCYQRERASACRLKHGATVARDRRDRPPEYLAWQDMLKRCHSGELRFFASYGGRGITVCDEWRHDFAAFRDHIGPKPSPAHSLDRIDNDRGYEPGNVRWATRSEQMRNTRQTIFITHNGETHCAIEWAHRTGIHKATIRARFHRGLPPWMILAPGRLPRNSSPTASRAPVE